MREDQRALTLLERLAALREGIAVGYVPLAAAQTDVRKLTVTESHPLMLPEAAWGKIKVGARTPPVRVREGWLAFIDGVDELEYPSGAALMRYCAGVIIQGAEANAPSISTSEWRIVKSARGRLDLCPENGCAVCPSMVKW